MARWIAADITGSEQLEPSSYVVWGQKYVFFKNVSKENFEFERKNFDSSRNFERAHRFSRKDSFFFKEWLVKVQNRKVMRSARSCNEHPGGLGGGVAESLVNIPESPPTLCQTWYK